MIRCMYSHLHNQNYKSAVMQISSMQADAALHAIGRVSDPMLNLVPKSIHFLDYLNFGALFDIFLLSICSNLCNLALVISLLM